MNQVTLCGRIGQEPELKYTASGTAVCNFSMATSERYKNKTTNEWEEKTEWHRVVCWAKTAEYVANHLKKGGQVLVGGKIATRTWEDKQGNKRYTTEIVSSQIENLSFSGGNENMGTAPAQPEYSVAADNNYSSDDIPF